MLYQSVGSSRCAIYAASNLLNLYGISIGRKDALHMFGVAARDRPRAVSHPTLRRVVAEQLDHSPLYWKRHLSFSFEWVCRLLDATLRRGAPTLMTFNIRHIHRDWSGVHCVVVTNVDDGGIHVIDSLGRRNDHWTNVTITQGESDVSWRVFGAQVIVTRGPVRVLDGLPPLQQRMRGGGMRPVPSELGVLLDLPKFMDFHGEEACGPTFSDDIRQFLESTMDEVRTTISSRIAPAILKTIDMTDFGAFREVVLRRELSATIAYEKQRDHSSHTVYNYLLGWYFYLNCAPLKQAFKREFTKRGVVHSSSRPSAEATLDPFSDHTTFFGCIWQYVSILHDVGYMFEGGIPDLDFRASAVQAAIGAAEARNYFHRLIWLDYELDLESMRDEFFGAVGDGVRPPAFENTESLAEIADALRSVGNLSGLSDPVNEELELRGLAKRRPQLDKLSSDAFELWAHHYIRFGRPRMAKRMKSLRRVFNVLIDKGMPEVGVRLLDHGVCSGLLQLVAATYYYRLYAATLSVSGKRPVLVQRFLDECDWSPAFWWTGIIWGTAAAAVHNVQQLATAKKLDPGWPGKLTLADDPLAYLGVLVDILEQWDRYSVFKALNREPIQGTDVELGNRSGKVSIRFLGSHGKKRAKNLRDDLDLALSGWRTLLDVRS